MAATKTTPDNTDKFTKTKFSIISLNINGLFEDNQKNKVFDYLISKKQILFCYKKRILK